MKCSVCGTECSESTKFCPTCGTPLQPEPQYAGQTQVMPGQQGYEDPMAYRQPSQEFAAQPARQSYESTRQMPPFQQPSGQFPRTGASQEFAAVPATPAMPGRSVDMSAATKSPKWPIVLIAVLLVLIVALVLIILHPWDTGAQPGTATVDGGNVVVTSNGDQSQQGGTEQGTVAGDTSAPVSDQQTAAPAADAFTQLTTAYNQLDGFHGQISSIATEFSDNLGVSDLSDLRNRAADLQAQISSARATLQAVAVDANSAYAQTKAAIDNLYNDLEMRISVLVEACDADIAGNDVSDILSRDNGPADDHGHTNKYLIDYEQNYEAARPVQA